MDVSTHLNGGQSSDHHSRQEHEKDEKERPSNTKSKKPSRSNGKARSVSNYFANPQASSSSNSFEKATRVDPAHSDTGSVDMLPVVDNRLAKLKLKEELAKQKEKEEWMNKIRELKEVDKKQKEEEERVAKLRELKEIETKRKEEEERVAKLQELKTGFETAKVVLLNDIFGDDSGLSEETVEVHDSQHFASDLTNGPSSPASKASLVPTAVKGPATSDTIFKYSSLDQPDNRDSALEQILSRRLGANRSLNNSLATTAPTSAVETVPATPEKDDLSDEDLLFPSDEDNNVEVSCRAASFTARKPLFAKNSGGGISSMTGSSGARAQGGSGEYRSGKSCDSSLSKENVGSASHTFGVGQVSQVP